MVNVWLLIWFTVVPEQGVKYHHLGTFDNETVCRADLRVASVLVNDTTETIECIGVKTDD
jgi:hypothetical protein|tara:strand:+ start:2287 stop:2466 length:180 start_codon:yes stop_codon:yes gene_type:complete